MEKLESAFLVSRDLIGIGKFHPGTSEESWSAFSLSIPTPSCTLGSFSTGFGYPQIQTFWALLPDSAGMKCLKCQGMFISAVGICGKSFRGFGWQILKEMQIPRKTDDRNILLLLFKLEILTLKQGSGVFFLFLEEIGTAIRGKYHLGSWKRDVWNLSWCF